MAFSGFFWVRKAWLWQNIVSCIFFTNLFWRESMTMQGVSFHSPKQTLIPNFCPKLTHVYPRVKIGRLMKVVAHTEEKMQNNVDGLPSLSKSKRDFQRTQKHLVVWLLCILSKCSHNLLNFYFHNSPSVFLQDDTRMRQKNKIENYVLLIGQTRYCQAEVYISRHRRILNPCEKVQKCCRRKRFW